MTGLKPCPFCGGKVTIADMGYGWMVTRGTDNNPCRCRVFMESELYFDDESKQRTWKNLIMAWNRRVSEAEEKRDEDVQ